MIAEEFDSGKWGSQRRAIAARTKRTKELEALGFEVDHTVRYYGAQPGYRGYRLFAHKGPEVAPVNPEDGR